MRETTLNSLDSSSDRVFSQRPHWLNFAAKICSGDVVIHELKSGSSTIGYLSGIKFYKWGIPIFGSPFPGWTTPYIGFNLVPSASRREALEIAEKFVFKDLGCLHFEITDRYLRPEDGRALGFETGLVHSYMSDLTLPEEQIFTSMSSACRRAIRKSEKCKVVIEEAAPDGFAAEYYEQLLDVFKKQNLRPTYSQQRVEQLIETVHSSGDLLLVRASDPLGRSIATGIYAGFGCFSYFWGNASLRCHQQLRPNEALHWFAMRYWKGRGMQWHDWGGGGAYKAKYGGTPYAVPTFFKSRLPGLSLARSAARSIYYLPRQYLKRRYQESIAQI